MTTAGWCRRELVKDREVGRLRPLYYFSPDLPEDEATLASPNGRWLKTLEFLWSYIPEREHHRVMLPTAPGLTKDDNNYADNPYLLCLASLGYKGAFWSRWRKRDEMAATLGWLVPASEILQLVLDARAERWSIAP